MNKVGLLVCGNSGIDYEKVDFPYEIIRSKLIIEGKEYEDFVDITADAFYEMLDKNPDLQISTAMISPGEILEKLNKFKKEGYKEVVAVVISSGLSGTYNTLKIVSEEVEDLKVYVVDSLLVTFGQLVQTYEAARLIKEGKSGLEIFNYLEKFKKRIRLFVLVDTLKYLVKNGRLSAASGMIGNLLKIKPLLKFNETGHLVPYQKIRTSSKARSRMIEIAKELIDAGTTPELFLGYTNNREYVEGIKKEILEYAPHLKITLHLLTPVVGAHAGPGTCGFGVIVNEEE
ncbi:MAG TPA: DegV family protein [Acholeplasma sp.]|jgi:DegV family protein with EDD domain|nr:DegV family protein [Acholeplasmatales bacterium]HHV33665.1 DegV family protein [Acholeplasma sp.]